METEKLKFDDVLPSFAHLGEDRLGIDPDFYADAEIEAENQRQLWRARVGEGVKLAGRIVAELGSFLSHWDEWQLRETVRNVPEPQPIVMRDTILPLQISNVRDASGNDIKTEGEDLIEIPPGGTFSMKSRPQVVFRPHRIVFLSDDCAPFSILDAQIGRNSQWAASGPVAAKMFSELAPGMSMIWDTAQISMDVSIRCQNVSGIAQRPPHVSILGKVSF
jgi:hypothetical protein